MYRYDEYLPKFKSFILGLNKTTSEHKLLPKLSQIVQKQHIKTNFHDLNSNDNTESCVTSLINADNCLEL